jgi:DNA/RNA non-specific endonuclease.
MKNEKNGILNSLLHWLIRVIISSAIGIIVATGIYKWSYVHVKPFNTFVNQNLSGSIQILNLSKESSALSNQTTQSSALPYQKKEQIVLGKVDVLGRATSAHIQLKNRDEPTVKRDSRISVNPVGWHNYKLEVIKGKKTWVMNRGHLVGYQFSGMNDVRENLVPETAWFNQGAHDHMDDSNPKAMLYYENRLDKWLSQHPEDSLDYLVTPIYHGSELIPRQIKLEYVGYTPKGQLESIRLGSPLENTKGVSTVVILDNTAPNLNINYQTGTVAKGGV